LAFAATLALTLVAAGATFAKDEELVPEARQAIEQFRRSDAGLDRFFGRAAGYAVFPGIGKGGYWIGGAHGTGVLFEGGVPSGKVTVTQVSVGPQVGGERFAEVIFFETPRALADFKQGKAAFSAQASAVAVNQGAAAVAKYERGVAIFTQMKGGMMAEASVGGQKFSYEPFAVRR